MAVGKIFVMGLVDNATEVFIRAAGFRVLEQGNWYQDDILAYAHSEVESFTWQDDNKLRLM